MNSLPYKVLPQVESIELQTPYPVLSHFLRRKPVSGIYILQNQQTDRCYVGASIRMIDRWLNHQSLLTWNRHTTLLQQEFNANPDDFCFRLIEKCSEVALAEREIYWMQEYESLSPDWGYNVRAPNYKVKKRHYDMSGHSIRFVSPLSATP